jgi:hypothetical protein
MTDLNDLKVFERVAALESFSAAGRALRIPKSTVSRCVARLEAQLAVRLIQRTTHSVCEQFEYGPQRRFENQYHDRLRLLRAF